jgi:hypothetical protein
MMPLRRRRKARGIEKVENICRTAPAQAIFANTPVHVRSRLRDSVGAGRRSGAAGSPGPALPEISYFGTEF